jgi:N-formylglutamate amidohydrolase
VGRGKRRLGGSVRSDYWDQPAFETIRPRRLVAPLVFNSAHSGRVYPERFMAMTRLDHLSIRQSDDAWVDELFARAPHLGAPLLRAHFPRAYLDVNREPWELDPTMFVEPLSDRFNTTSPRVAAGLGTLARVAFGVALLIDCHSMPRITRTNDKAAPDIVLGDRYGTTCAPMLVDLVETIFTSAGLRVARNRPYAGGFATRTYGRPQHGVHALQIEISRHLYMNEVTLAKNEGFDPIRALLDRLIFALIGLDLVALAGSQPVAEKAAAE